MEPNQPDIEKSALFQLWTAKRAGRRYPARKDFDVLELVPWIGDIELVDIVRTDRVRYRYRLVGTNINDIDGIDVTGRFADEAFRDSGQFVVREYDEVLRTGEPSLKPKIVEMSRRGFEVLYHKLVLPLAADGETIDMLLVYFLEIASPADAT